MEQLTCSDAVKWVRTNGTTCGPGDGTIAQVPVPVNQCVWHRCCSKISSGCPWIMPFSVRNHTADSLSASNSCRMPELLLHLESAPGMEILKPVWVLGEGCVGLRRPALTARLDLYPAAVICIALNGASNTPCSDVVQFRCIKVLSCERRPASLSTAGMSRRAPAMPHADADNFCAHCCMHTRQ